MNKKFFYITMAALAVVLLSQVYSLSCLIRDTKEPVNMCNQTISEANNPINWHNGIYSPEGCNLIKQ